MIEQSAYSFHPELEEKIVSPLSSFFRTFSVESVFEKNPDLLWVLELLHTDDDCEQSRAQTLAFHRSSDLWIFAIGSLIWNPKFEVSDRRPALVRGWRRSFCLGPDRRMRGNPSAPGMMLSMDRGGECWGVAMRMQPDDLLNALVALLKLEPPCPPEWVQAETEFGIVPAIAFIVDHDFPLYQPEPPVHELADILASAVGHIGSMADYLLNTITELENTGVHDPHLWTLQDMVAERLEKLG